jgi:hypothetical protein
VGCRLGREERGQKEKGTRLEDPLLQPLVHRAWQGRHVRNCPGGWGAQEGGMGKGGRRHVRASGRRALVGLLGGLQLSTAARRWCGWGGKNMFSRRSQACMGRCWFPIEKRCLACPPTPSWGCMSVCARFWLGDMTRGLRLWFFITRSRRLMLREKATIPRCVCVCRCMYLVVCHSASVCVCVRERVYTEITSIRIFAWHTHTHTCAGVRGHIRVSINHQRRHSSAAPAATLLHSPPHGHRCRAKRQRRGAPVLRPVTRFPKGIPDPVLYGLTGTKVEVGRGGHGHVVDGGGLSGTRQ